MRRTGEGCAAALQIGVEVPELGLGASGVAARGNLLRSRCGDRARDSGAAVASVPHATAITDWSVNEQNTIGCMR